jgi:transposase
VPKKPTYSPEFREEAAKMVVESSRPIVQVAREIKVNEATLGGWVKRYRDKHADGDPELQLPDRARLRELERENRELRMKVTGSAKSFVSLVS